MLPELLVPEKQRDPKWGAQVGRAIVTMCDPTAQKYDQQAFDHLDGNYDKSEFEYVTKHFGLDVETPAQFRHIPLMRKHYNALVGEESLRALNYRVYSIDADTIRERQQEMAMKALTRTRDLLYQAQQMRVQAHASRQPDNSQYWLEAELEKLEKYFKYSHQSVLEIATQKGVTSLVQKYNYASKKNELFKNKIVTGKPIWQTIARPGRDPIIEVVPPQMFYYCPNTNDPWIKNSDWCMRERSMSPNEILDFFNGQLKPADVEKLKKWSLEYSQSSQRYYSGKSPRLNPDGSYDSRKAFRSGSDVYQGTIDDFGKLRVCHVEWIVNRVEKEKVDKKADGTVFTKLVGDTYVPEKPGKEIITKYIQDRYEIYIIAGEIEACFRRVPVVRDEDNPSKATLSYNGRNYNFSLTESVNDLQILYNILHYHREAMIALSGSKGMVYDLAQKPDDYSLEEIMYYKKLGLLLINSKQKGSSSNFNQFQSYDDTLPAAIEIISSMIDQIDNLCGDIMGVPPQRRGATKADELVGNNEMAIEKSATVTAALFKEHDECVREMLNDATNALKICWKDGKEGQYILNDYEYQVFTMPANALDNRTMGIFFSDSGMEAKKIQELRAVATQAAQKSMQETGIDFADLVKIFSKESLREIQLEVEHAIAKKKEEMQRAAQQEGQAKAQTEQAKADMEGQKFQNETRQKDRELDLKELEINLKYAEGGIENRKIEQKEKEITEGNKLEEQRLGLEKMQAEQSSGSSQEVKNK